MHLNLALRAEHFVSVFSTIVPRLPARMLLLYNGPAGSLVVQQGMKLIDPAVGICMGILINPRTLPRYGLTLA